MYSGVFHMNISFYTVHVTSYYICIRTSYDVQTSDSCVLRGTVALLHIRPDPREL